MALQILHPEGAILERLLGSLIEHAGEKAIHKKRVALGYTRLAIQGFVPERILQWKSASECRDCNMDIQCAMSDIWYLLQMVAAVVSWQQFPMA